MHYCYYICVVSMAPKGWKTITLPEKMINTIQDFIETDEIKSRYGFTSKSEFIRKAIANYIVQIERELKIGTDYMLTAEEHRRLDKEERENV